MINLLLQEGKRYLSSDEYSKSLAVIANNFVLDEDEMGYLSMAISGVISGSVPEESFTKKLRDLSEIKRDKIDKIYAQAREHIFIPFKKRLSDMLQNTQMPVTPPHEPDTIGITTLRQPSQPTPASAPSPTPDLPTKSSILSEIENPPRTVIKRYVLEHEPITDPDHLIDDTIDERPRLQS